MKYLIGIICFVVALSSGSAIAKNGHSRKSDKKSEAVYRPLLTSNWFKANPDRLPYSKCRIEETSDQQNEKRPKRVEIGALISASGEPGHGNSKNYLLVCKAPIMGLAFALPVALKNHWGIGPQFMALVGINDIKMHKLAGQTVMDLFGKYKGFEAGIGAIFSASGGRYENKVGIQISRGMYGGGYGVKFGYSEFELIPRYPTLDELKDPRVIPLDLKEVSLPEGITFYDPRQLSFIKIGSGKYIYNQMREDS